MGLSYKFLFKEKILKFRILFLDLILYLCNKQRYFKFIYHNLRITSMFFDNYNLITVRDFVFYLPIGQFEIYIGNNNVSFYNTSLKL